MQRASYEEPYEADRPVDDLASRICIACSRFEAFGGMLIIGVLCFVVSIIAIYIAVDPPHGDPDVWLWRAIPIAIASAELGSFWLMFRCCRSGAFPLRRLPQSQVWIPLLLRPIVAGWWLFHFAGLAVGIHFFLPTFFGGNNVRPALALHLLGLVWLLPIGTALH